MRFYNCHHPTPGSRVKASVMNALVIGMASYTQVNIDESDGVEKDLELEPVAEEDFDAL